jgi:ribonuclease P protein component
VLIALQNEEDRTRIGVAAGRTLGNAVNRNRAKRVLRAGIRPFLGNISPGWDILLIARKPLLGLKSLEAEQSLKVLLDRAHLWCEKKEF